MLAVLVDIYILDLTSTKIKKTQPVRKHLEECGLGKPSMESIEGLTLATRGYKQLAISEALYTRELLKPALNTRDEFIV